MLNERRKGANRSAKREGGKLCQIVVKCNPITVSFNILHYLFLTALLKNLKDKKII